MTDFFKFIVYRTNRDAGGVLYLLELNCERWQTGQADLCGSIAAHPHLTSKTCCRSRSSLSKLIFRFTFFARYRRLSFLISHFLEYSFPVVSVHAARTLFTTESTLPSVVSGVCPKLITSPNFKSLYALLQNGWSHCGGIEITSIIDKFCANTMFASWEPWVDIKMSVV